MKSLKVYYAKVPNMGDLLNVMVIEQLFGYKVKRHTFLTGELSAIGSGLGQFTLRNNRLVALVERIFGFLFPNCVVWGTGFISYADRDNGFYRRNMRFAAVRGRLSKHRVEKILGEKLEIPMGDAGILASYLYKEPIKKKYDVGIIAHFKEQDAPEFRSLAMKYPNSILIDVRQHPSIVIHQISECKTIISSSLHGLIIADSFHIPNIHIIVTDKLLGDGFKFDDYYSAYGLEHRFLNLKKDEIPGLDWVRENYALSLEMVENKKREMVEAFPFQHNFKY